MLHTALRLILLLVIGLSAISCDTAPAPEVSYLVVDTLMVDAGPNEGTSSARLTTLWVEQNGQQIGAFLPPCTIPVLAGEDQLIRLIPGININGFYSQRNQYEMLSPKSFTWDLGQGAVRNLSTANTTFEYNPNYSLVVLEDFDGVGLNFLRSSQSDTNLVLTDDVDEAFQYPGETPNTSGKLVMAPTTIGEFTTLQAFELPQFGANVWLEVNYKTDVPLTFGVVANEQLQSIQAPVVTLFANKDWNKVYINLVSEVSGYPQAGDYNIFFGAINATDDTATVLIDNIKLLY